MINTSVFVATTLTPTWPEIFFSLGKLVNRVECADKIDELNKKVNNMDSFLSDMFSDCENCDSCENNQ